MDATRENRHRERMQRKKAVVDAAIGHATADRGILLVLAGNGKGKSSLAFGMVARALGHGMRSLSSVTRPTSGWSGISSKART